MDNFAQRLWAFLTIKELLRKRIAADGRDEKAALTQRALELSLKYHFVTPLTSLIVVKPDNELDITEPRPESVLRDELEGIWSRQISLSVLHLLWSKAVNYASIML